MEGNIWAARITGKRGAKTRISQGGKRGSFRVPEGWSLKKIRGKRLTLQKNLKKSRERGKQCKSSPSRKKETWGENGEEGVCKDGGWDNFLNHGRCTKKEGEKHRRGSLSRRQRETVVAGGWNLGTDLH